MADIGSQKSFGKERSVFLWHNRKARVRFQTNSLAMKKKQQMMEARMGKRVLTRPAFGGFVGVGAILAGSKNTSPMTRRRTPKPTSLEDNVDIPPPEDCELLIMGIIRDKKEQAYHEAHQVCFCSIILSPPHLKRCYFR